MLSESKIIDKSLSDPNDQAYHELKKQLQAILEQIPEKPEQQQAHEEQPQEDQVEYILRAPHATWEEAATYGLSLGENIFTLLYDGIMTDIKRKTRTGDYGDQSAFHFISKTENQDIVNALNYALGEMSEDTRTSLLQDIATTPQHGQKSITNPKTTIYQMVYDMLVSIQTQNIPSIYSVQDIVKIIYNTSNFISEEYMNKLYEDKDTENPKTVLGYGYDLIEHNLSIKEQAIKIYNVINTRYCVERFNISDVGAIFYSANLS